MKKICSLFTIFTLLVGSFIGATEESPVLPSNTIEKKKVAPVVEYEENSFWHELINMLVTLGLILIVLTAIIWIMKRMQTTRIKYNNDSSLIKIIDHRALSAKSSLYLVEIKGKTFLVGDSQNGITKVGDVHDLQ